MSKKVKILALTLLILGLMVGLVYAYGSGKNTVELKDANNVYHTYELYDGQNIWVNSDSGMGWDMLDNPNVLCAEHRGPVVDGWYKVYNNISVSSSKTNESDSILAYILNRLPDNRTTYTTEPSQIAFWQYLCVYQSTNGTHARDKILESLSTNAPTEIDGNYDQDSHDAGIKLYDEAVTYANNYKNHSVSISSATYDYETNKLTINITGNFENLTLNINNQRYGSYNSSTRQITVSNANQYFTTDGEININVYATFTKYEAKYRVLKKYQSQRMIVVTYTNAITETKTASYKVERTNVSLQKYISEVNGQLLTKSDIDLDNSVTEAQREANNNDEEAFLYRRWAKSATASSNTTICGANNGSGDGIRYAGGVQTKYQSQAYYKTNNPVMIEVGDTVTYNIYAYNNEPNRKAKDVIIKDCLQYAENGNKLSIGDSASNVSIVGATIAISPKKGGYGAEEKMDYSLANNTISFNAFTLTEGATARITIKIRFNIYTENKLKNYAYIAMDKNQTNYRTQDADYVKMNKYDVSLQKYISEVNGKSLVDIYNSGDKYIVDQTGYSTENITNANNDNGQSMLLQRWAKKATSISNINICTENGGNRNVGYVYGIYRSDAYYKINRPVNIEAGDTVTYSIYAYNNETNHYARNVIVKDYLQYAGNGNKLSIGDSASNVSIVGATIAISPKKGGYGAEEKMDYSLANNTISFNAFTLTEGATARITIKIRFNFYTKEKLRNYAYLDMGTRNKTTYRAQDADYVQMKEYKVSLDKFVSKVNGKSVHDEKYDFNSDGTVDFIDVRYLQGYIAGTSYNDSIKQKIKENADVNGDGSINNKDLIRLSSIIRDKKRYNTSATDKTNISNYNPWKYNNPVTVSYNDKVTYTIRITNDGETQVKNITIQDILPTGVEFQRVEDACAYKYSTDNIPTSVTVRTIRTDNGRNFKFNDVWLNKGESVVVRISVTVTESNMSINVLENTAKILDNKMKNKNGIDVIDTTLEDNQDADYIQMKDIVISGTVWNDVAWDKAQKDYNGQYDNEEGKDKLLNSSIDVYLYRVEQGKEPEIVGSTYTDSKNGQYSFNKDNLNYVSDQARKYIKGPQDTDTNRWSGTYYSYYVVFEYDGVTYTSTKFADVTSDNSLDSNAKEDNGLARETRTDFNNRFSKINSNGAYDNNDKYTTNITYTTKNESGYIPQSIHEYNPSTMAIQSSTSLINLKELAESDDIIEEKLQHVNLGLRGRDTFDLKLVTDVYSTQVTVNDVPGVYQYNNNKVTLRKSDIGVVEDAANIANEQITSSVTEVDQNIRKTDIKNEKYGSTGLKIQVTYEITVQNVSTTDGTATVVTDYFDDKYNFQKAYVGDYEMTIENRKAKYGTTGTGYNSVVLTTPSTNLTTTDGGTNKMEIYLVFELRDAEKTLKEFFVEEGKISLPTFNIAEITEYKTQRANGQSEATRGLLDMNSAPGSIDKEQARLTKGEQTLTTLQYYFYNAIEYLKNESKDLNKLKYEDDTSAAPILYFTSSDSERTITGTVFEDKTTTNPTTKIKTGNGKLDEGEVGVYGATVELVKLKIDEAPQNIGETDGTVITTVHTDKNGKFTISGFLPGYYVIRYHYGDTTNTVLLHQGGENINKQSYNGEDYQSTNNAFEVQDEDGNVISNILDRSKGNLWYVMNKDKGISTGTDNTSRRNKVSKDVTKFIDEEMTVLNNMRDGKNEEDAKVTYVKDGNSKTVTVSDIIEATKMFARTPKMLFTVEQTINLNELGDKKQALIDSKKITVNPDGELGEWAMFPDANNEHYKSYLIENMNFGIAEVPVTTIDLQKTVQAFNLTDSTGKNTIASVVKNDSGKWELKGDVIAPDGATSIDVSVEDEKLQGARLQVTYGITSNITVERNYDQKGGVEITINGLNDIIDNNLSYNVNLRDNSAYWEITTMEKSSLENVSNYTNIMKANKNALEKINKGETIYITLEKILSSTDSTIEEIITSTVDIYAYNNIVEITGINYKNVTPPNSESSESEQRDRVRTPDRYIIIPGVQHDSKTAETITIHPPTGDSSISIMYYVIAALSLVILAAGVFGIKKFVLKK